MTIPNPVFRYLHELVGRLRKKKTEKDLTEIHNIAHHLLSNSMNAAVTMRSCCVVFGDMARKDNSLSKWELVGKLQAHAEALESAVKAGGGYMKYEEKAKS